VLFVLWTDASKKIVLLDWGRRHSNLHLLCTDLQVWVTVPPLITIAVGTWAPPVLQCHGFLQYNATRWILVLQKRKLILNSLFCVGYILTVCLCVFKPAWWLLYWLFVILFFFSGQTFCEVCTARVANPDLEVRSNRRVHNAYKSRFH
jgi:hypothetical protein